MNNLISYDDFTVLINILGVGLPSVIFFIISYYFFYIKKIKKEQPQNLVYYPLALFFLICGITQIYFLITIWFSIDLVEIILKTLLTGVSLYTIIILIRKRKSLLNFSPFLQLADANQQLKAEIAQHIAHGKDLFKKEQLLNAAIVNAPIGLVTVGLDGSWLTVNRALCKMLGYDESELLATDFQKITHPDDLDKDLALIQKVAEQVIDYYDVEKRYLHKQGHYIWGWLSVSLLKNGNGEPVHFISQIVDINERKEVEIKLSQSEKMFRQLIKLAPIGMAILKLDGTWLTVNRALCQMLGYTESELLRTDFQSITHPDDLQKGIELTQKLSTQEIEKWDIEKRYLHKKGHYVWGWISVSFLKDTNGKPIYFISQIIDISERKKINIRLRQSEIMFQQTMKYAPIGKSLLTADFKWVSVNSALCKILGYTEKELLKKKLTDLIYPEDVDKGEELVIKLMEREVSSIRIEKRHLHKDGSILWIELNISIIWDKNKFLHLLMQWANITPLKNKTAQILEFNKQLENKVEERTSELKEANKELENFTYVLTHDLRQPLKNMANLSTLVKKEHGEALDEEGLYMLNLIEKNALKVDSLIVDMMSYAKSSRANLTKNPVDLNTLFQEAFTDCKLPYEAKEITFEVDGLPLVLGDNIALKQVCLNLVSNALKYSSKKEQIKIKITCSEKNEMVVFSIKDNGAGFDNALSYKIFEVFQRLHQNSDFAGTGIGMPITAKIIEKHGGKIWAKGKEEEGATFYFTLPLYCN